MSTVAHLSQTNCLLIKLLTIWREQLPILSIRVNMGKRHTQHRPYEAIGCVDISTYRH